MNYETAKTLLPELVEGQRFGQKPFDSAPLRSGNIEFRNSQLVATRGILAFIYFRSGTNTGENAALTISLHSD